jgi:hypothetical protein
VHHVLHRRNGELRIDTPEEEVFMKANRKGRVAIVVTALLASVIWAATAAAATTYSDYVVFGTHGVMIGGGSQVVGMVGARFNNDDNGNVPPPPVYPQQPDPALNMAGGSKILGTANIGEAGSSADVSAANGVTITQLYYVDQFNSGSGFTGTATQQPGGTDLPVGTLLGESVWPGGFGTGCPTGGTDYTSLGNGFDLTLTPGSYGEIQGGGGPGTNLIFDGAGDYYIDRLQAANGLQFVLTEPGVRLFVCEEIKTGSGIDVLPTTLLPADFIVEVYGLGIAAGTNAFASGGGNWIGNLLVPTRGVHYGNGTESGTWKGYMWADHIDIEHSLVATKLSKKSGVKFNDHDGNGIRDQGDEGLAGWTIYVDYNDDGVLDPDEPFAITGVDGSYEIADIIAGTWKVREVQMAGWECTYPATNDGKPDIAGGCYHQETFVDGGNYPNNDFGNFLSQPDEHVKSGYKFNDLNGNHAWDNGEPGLNDWTITVWDETQTNIVFQDTTHDDGNLDPGYYEFALLDGVTYVVCETAQAGWIQTFPVLGPANVVLCVNEGTLGYEVTLDGADEPNNNFGNAQAPWCEKQPVQAVLNPATGQYPGNKGPDVVVRVDLGQSVQDAVDNTGDANNDGYIIIAVSAHADGSLGGSANQKVSVWMNYGDSLPFALIGCSVTLTGGGGDAAVWIKSTANAKNVTVNGRTTDIFVMDLHGASSAVGVQADGMYRYLRNEYGIGNGVGIKVVGNYNTVHNGKGEANTGDGVYVSGYYNQLSDTDSFSNGGNGFFVVGSYNKLLKLDAGDKGKGNGADGVRLVGASNTISENGAFANGGDGIDVEGSSNALSKNVAGDKGKGNIGSGIRVNGASNSLTENKASANAGDGFVISGALTSATANLLKNNQSNTGTENTGAEYRIANWIKNNAGGNKVDGTTLPNATKMPAGFPASGASKNFASAVVAE